MSRRHASGTLSLAKVCLLLCLCFPAFCRAKNKEKSKREPQRVISLAESISKTTNSLQDASVEEIRKQYWQKALADIRNMSLGFTKNREENGFGGGILGQEWKFGIEQNPIVLGAPTNDTSTVAVVDTNAGESLDINNITIPVSSRRGRFEGFMSWERMLQEWADDVQEYLEEVERESTGVDYAFGNFGRSAKISNVESVREEKINDDIESEEMTFTSSDAVDESLGPESATETTKSSTTKSESETDAEDVTEPSQKDSHGRIPLPIPSPAQPGEAVLPETDLSDLSKRVEIITTASLPWRTGTAVNPLLRAAYLTLGRTAAGGSVTLMLPWLERRSDQEKVYGPSQTFDSPEEQEAYIRDWLRNTANMPEAAEDLRIRWYTAWQNPAENSIYSMGDITALIPPDEVDICILEEPEHLNWYRAPGESWTKRFKHVVGILHTSKFCFYQWCAMATVFCLCAYFLDLFFQTTFPTPWINLLRLCVPQRCDYFVLGCAVHTAIELSNFLVRLIKWHLKKNSSKMCMAFEARLWRLEPSYATSCCRHRLLSTPCLLLTQSRPYILLVRCCGPKAWDP